MAANEYTCNDRRIVGRAVFCTVRVVSKGSSRSVLRKVSFNGDPMCYLRRGNIFQNTYLDETRLFKLLMYLKHHSILSTYVESAMKCKPSRLFGWYKPNCKFQKTYEPMEGFCFVRSVTCFSRPQSETDGGGDDVENKCYCGNNFYYRAIFFIF
jgi:hypothetical protein